MGKHEIKKNTTFWKEISGNIILIPDYQRDYAQGRKESRIDNIRKVFVGDLFNAVSSGVVCHTGLVYGSFDEENKIFIAVDGQQRLTTVFLFYWFLLWKSGNREKMSILKNYKWQTRNFSSQFVDLLFAIEGSDNVIQAIENSIDYFSIWENDPTVVNMKEMLSEIENQYNKYKDNVNLNKLFEKDCKIQFDILKLSAGSDGKTYLKMNSRGRQLATFENFKNKFVEYLNKSNLGSTPLFEKIDNDWMNFMLRRANDGNGNFGDPDICYMNYINEYVYIQKVLEGRTKNEREVLAKAKKTGDWIDVPFVRFTEYEEVFVSIDGFVKFTDFIVDNYDRIKKIDDSLRFDGRKFFLDQIIKENPTINQRVKFVALMRFAELTNYEMVDEIMLHNWIRVSQNLIENTYINDDEKNSRFANICKSIQSINSADVFNWIRDNGIEYFDSAQLKEEIEKAEKILSEPEWESKIIAVEKYAFFKGAIRFLYRDGEDKVDWGVFDEKVNNIKILIPKEVNQRHTIKLFVPYITEQALCSIFYNWTSVSDEDLRTILLCKDSVPYLHNFLLQNDVKAPFSILHQDIIDICEVVFEGRGYIQPKWTEQSNYVWTNYVNRSGYYRWCSYVIGNSDYSRLSNIIANSNKFEIHKDQYDTRIGSHIRALYLLFKCNGHFLTLYGNNTICLMTDGWSEKWPNPNDSKGFYFSVDNIETEQELIKQIDSLVKMSISY